MSETLKISFDSKCMFILLLSITLSKEKIEVIDSNSPLQLCWRGAGGEVVNLRNLLPLIHQCKQRCGTSRAVIILQKNRAKLPLIAFMQPITFVPEVD